MGLPVRLLKPLTACSADAGDTKPGEDRRRQTTAIRGSGEEWSENEKIDTRSAFPHDKGT